MRGLEAFHQCPTPGYCKFNLTKRLELRMIRVVTGKCNVEKERWSHEFSQDIGSGAAVQCVS